MDSILNTVTPAQLITANEENLSAFLPEFGKLGEMHVNNPPGVKRSITDIPMALVNSIKEARLELEQVEPVILTVISDARRRKVPIMWWIGPSTQPLNLGKRLEEQGFIHDDEAPGMGANLMNLDENLPVLEGLSIKHVQGEESCGQWCRTMALGFEVPPPYDLFVNSWQELLRRVDPDTTLPFTGLLHGKPVATSLLFMAAGVVGIYSVSTIPEACRKGIGALMTLQPLLHARSRGYRFGILQESEMGLKVYRALGFPEYCRIHLYVWRPEKGSDID